MIYPNTPAEKWRQMYKIKDTQVPCYKCKVPQPLSIPYADGTIRGLLTPLHECGEKYRSFVFRDINPQKDAEWKELFDVLSCTLSLR